jgi:hypothetical protein
MGDHIDNGIADADDIDAGLCNFWLWPGRKETSGEYRGLSFPGKVLTTLGSPVGRWRGEIPDFYRRSGNFIDLARATAVWPRK